MRFTKLWAIYHADGGLVGELAYIVGRLVGTAHCGLCDITHGATGMKRAWKQAVAELPVPVVLVHRNEQPEEIAWVTRGRTPCVVGEGGDGFELLLDAQELDAMEGSVEALFRRLSSLPLASRLSR